MHQLTLTSIYRRFARVACARLAILISVGLIALTGCETIPQSGGRTTAERQLNQQVSLFSKSNLQACATVGLGLAGAELLRATLTGDKVRGERLAIAGVIGCGVGVGVNSYVQTQRQRYSSNEARLNAMIADVRKDNQKLAALIASAEQVIADDKRRIAMLEQANRTQAVSVAEARAELDRVRANRDQVAAALEAAQERESDWSEISREERQVGANTRALDAEIERMEGKVAQLERQYAEATELVDTFPIPA